MAVNLAGTWQVELEAKNGTQMGMIRIPGNLQAKGYGNPVEKDTEFVSGLYDPFWYEQEEYKYAQEDGCQVPFLSQPPRHFLGEAWYERTFVIPERDFGAGKEGLEKWFLRIELTHWRTRVWIDGEYRGEDCSLCTAHEINCGYLAPGEHRIRICVDNSMQYPYRPDGHGVSDGLGATWNGMAGEVILERASEKAQREAAHREYAKAHPRHMETKDNAFYVDGHPFYLRATHFGGEYPLTGYPETDIRWWKKMMETIKAWGCNTIRCHSCCPPEAAFKAADEEGILFLVECGMWNVFEEGIEMNDVLKKESRRILEEFGHHPSFAFFSPSNEPGGAWYRPLEQWMEETKAFDEALGYGGRRLYTAQSGWFYDKAPAEITKPDFIYFHRSAYGPFDGGTIRGEKGWRGGDYTKSLEGAVRPVVCHELGQWCAYPDYSIIDKMTGYLQPGNFRVYREFAREKGLLPLAEEMKRCSGENQLRLYKEDLEANFRTPEIGGFELLDLHDYLGQGTALVGILDAFWEQKGYGSPETFREYNGDTVLLLRCPSYVLQSSQPYTWEVLVSHFGKEPLIDQEITWKLTVEDRKGCLAKEQETKKAAEIETYKDSNLQEKESFLDGRKAEKNGKSGKEQEKVLCQGTLYAREISCGKNTELGSICLDLSGISAHTMATLHLQMGEVMNHWTFTIFADKKVQETAPCLYTRDWQEAWEGLSQGKAVVYAPYMSDLSYECPSLSMKNVFWNSQMGPTWSRCLGMVVQENHPIFQDFPTEHSGGWQWEDILAHARGFRLTQKSSLTPIVRIIDDWNRNLALSLLLEARVGKGRLLLVSACLEGDPKERPAAYFLKQAILRYVSSESFAPTEELSREEIEENLFPIGRMEEIVEDWDTNEDTTVSRKEALFDPNPNTSVRLERAEFPVTVHFSAKEKERAAGLLYLPEQRDSAHEGFLKDYEISYLDGAGSWKVAAKGSFQDTSLSQSVFWEKPVSAKEWKLTVYSCYGCEKKRAWIQTHEGWKKIIREKSAVLQIAGLHLLGTKLSRDGAHTDERFWMKGQKSATKEIDA